MITPAHRRTCWQVACHNGHRKNRGIRKAQERGKYNISRLKAEYIYTNFKEVKNATFNFSNDNPDVFNQGLKKWRFFFLLEGECTYII